MHLGGAIVKIHGFLCKKGAIFTLCSENKEVLAAGSDGGMSVMMGKPACMHACGTQETGERGRGRDVGLLSAWCV